MTDLYAAYGIGILVLAALASVGCMAWAIADEISYRRGRRF